MVASECNSKINSEDMIKLYFIVFYINVHQYKVKQFSAISLKSNKKKNGNANEIAVVLVVSPQLFSMEYTNKANNM